MKNCKTCYKAQTGSSLNKIIQSPPNSQLTCPPPPSDKSHYVFGIKIFLRRYTEIYKHLLSNCFKNEVLERQEMVHRKCFSDSKQKYFCWKICKARKVFDCVAGAYYFQCEVSLDS